MDWIRFLDENNIHYVTRGPNTKRGEVSVHCPLCGPDDPSEHLGINPESGAWGCLRDNSHRGKSAKTLVRALLACSGIQANHIITQYSHADPDSLEGALALLDPTPVMQEAPKIDPNREFKTFRDILTRGTTKRFYQYLEKRGYHDPYGIIDYYDLKCAVVGKYKDRLIIPIRQSGELLGWTSRAIVDPRDAPRYLASSSDVKATVFNYDNIKDGGDKLFIVEGPFDALRIDDFGRKNGMRATCTFGTDVTTGQIILLRALMRGFKETWVLFDNNADGPAQRLADWTNAKTAKLPPGVKDPGELNATCLKDMRNQNFDGIFWWTNSYTASYTALLMPKKYTLKHRP